MQHCSGAGMSMARIRGGGRGPTLSHPLIEGASQHLTWCSQWELGSWGDAVAKVSRQDKGRGLGARRLRDKAGRSRRLVGRWLLSLG